MYQLEYVTKGNSSPHGKERVYFTCHPEDFDLYFPEVQKEIFATQNCAIYYDPDLRAQREEAQLHDYLQRSQIIVIPITSRFLYTENRARCVEFAYAMEQGLTVLPLIREGGLAEAFGQICGKLQYLDSRNVDPTAISYEEKLARFLKSKLLGDDLAEKVRKAFDAYIFLSYRKVDRRFAQELMRLIHKNDFCRDIAIWYDEYLVPGEDFSTAIRQALHDSKLFAMVVTPRILDKNEKGEDNYVKAVEFPAAMDERNPTPVLPVEMEATDRAEVQDAFAGIPPIVGAGEEELLRQLLEEKLKDCALRENDTDPVHNFFIGLAYLCGIDVEVDRARAVELITASAQADVPEAVEKLVDMYRTGEAVARDYRVAIDWQRRLVQLLEKQLQAEPAEEHLRRLLYANFCLGDYCRELGNLTQAAAAVEKCAALCGTWGETYDCRRDLSVCYSKLAVIFQAQGNDQAAGEQFEKDYAICRELAEEVNSQRAWRDLFFNRLLSADLEKNRSAPEAEARYREALEIALRLENEEGTMENRQNLSLAYNRLGNLQWERGLLTSAREYYGLQLQLDEDLVAEFGGSKNRRELAISYINMGDVCRAAGELQPADEFYRQALKGIRSLFEETWTLESHRDLALVYADLGMLHLQMGDYAGAQEFYEEERKVSQAAAEFDESVGARERLALVYNRFGNLYFAQKQMKKAESWYRRQLSEYEALVRETQLLTLQRELAITYLNLGDVCARTHRKKQAVQWYLQSLQILEKLEKTTKKTQTVQDLALLYRSLGDVHEKMHKHKKAIGWYEKGLEQALVLARSDESIDGRYRVFLCYNNLGAACCNGWRFRRAEGYFLQGLEEIREICRVMPTPAMHRERKVATYNVATAYANRLRFIKAFRYLGKWIALSMEDV